LIVRPGEILGVSGASGAGKTTLLRVIAGAVGGYSGRIQRPDGRLAFVFQEPRLLPWLSARDNVLLTLDRRVPGRFFTTSSSMACARAMNEQRVTPRRASELTLGVLSGGAPDDATAARPMAGPPQG